MLNGMTGENFSKNAVELSFSFLSLSLSHSVYHAYSHALYSTLNPMTLLRRAMDISPTINKSINHVLFTASKRQNKAPVNATNYFKNRMLSSSD